MELYTTTCSNNRSQLVNHIILFFSLMNVDESSMEYQAEMVCSVDGGSFVFTQQKYYSQGYSMCQYLGK